MKVLLVAFLLLAASIARAADPLPAPGDWRREQFTFPLPFAPSIPYEGTEHVRFSPQWAKFADEDGFTYIVLWELKARTLEPQDFERGLAVYFDGLMENVARGRKTEGFGVASVIALHPAAAAPGWEAMYGGRVYTLNAFGMGEPLALHAEITHRRCASGGTQVVMAFSKAARDRPAWTALRDIRAKVACPA